MEVTRVGLATLLSGEASQNVLACFFLLAVVLMLGYTSKKRHWVYFPESSAALVLGVAFGSLSSWLNPTLAFTFEPEVFFYGLLPIIIFNAGYGLKKRDFFRNFATITLFAVVGTIISTLVYGLLTYSLFKHGYVKHMVSESPLLESLMFGALISAIDPVATLSIFQDVNAPTLLYNVVFGESLVNDATCIVLFRTFESFTDEKFGLGSIVNAIFRFILISVGSIILGVLVSLAGALALKIVEVRTEYTKFELAIILISAYISYSVAEILDLSGIMSLFFCGICTAHYSYYSTTHASKVASKYAFEALAFMSEMFVFAYLGMQVVVARQVVDWGLVLSAIPLCLLARAANIFPLAWLSNRFRSKKIPNSMKLAMWFSGLRGAIAFALSVNMPTRNPAIETTTLFVCITTTVFLGGATAPLLKALDLVASSSDPHGAAGAAGDSDSRDHSPTAPLDIEILRRASGQDHYDETNSELPRFHAAFKWIDSRYLKPLFGGQLDVSLEQATAEASSLISKLGEFVPYQGAGFSLDVPSSWIPTPSPYAVASFVSPSRDALGVSDAEVDVIIFPVPASVDDADPSAFLLLCWSHICPELSPPSSKPEEEMNLQRAHSHSSFPITTTKPVDKVDKAPAKSIDKSPSLGQASSPAVEREDEAASLVQRADSRGSIREQLSGTPVVSRVNSNKRVLRAGGRVVPAFVMHCDYSTGSSGNDLFRYEIMSHPEDFGTQKATVRHYYIAVWRGTSGIVACRVKAGEAFLFDGGMYPVTLILNSFKTEESAEC